MGRILGEIAAFLVVLVLINYLFQYLRFKYQVMVRTDKEKFYERHALDDDFKEDFKW